MQRARHQLPSRLTIKLWLRGLEKRADEVRRLVGEVKYRMWRLYLAGSAHYFQKGWLGLCQALLVKNDDGQNWLSLTRQPWYCATSSRLAAGD
ncbi:MAG: class I SAM-dependent methyltransferase [Terriglobales bacterium]